MIHPQETIATLQIHINQRKTNMEIAYLYPADELVGAIRSLLNRHRQPKLHRTKRKKTYHDTRT